MIALPITMPAAPMIPCTNLAATSSSTVAAGYRGDSNAGATKRCSISRSSRASPMGR